MQVKNKYFLLRHGQTIYQKENRNLIYLDEENDKLEITEQGKEKIKQQAERLKNKNIDLIFSSPYLRTRQTAKIVNKILQKEIIFDNRLVDIKMGEFAGKETLVYDSFFIDKKLGFTQRPKDGENWNDIIERVTDFLNDIETKYQNKNILIISHGDPLWIIAGILRGLKTLDEFLETRQTKDNNLYLDVGDFIII